MRIAVPRLSPSRTTIAHARSGFGSWASNHDTADLAVPRNYTRSLTGPPEAVAAAKAAYKVESTPLEPSWKGTPRTAHGSFVYLMGPDGALLTVLPPVLGPARMAEILRGYLG